VKSVENSKLPRIAEWLDRASRWLEEEVRDNRERDRIEGTTNSQEDVEVLTFLRPELDRMVTGFRRAADMLVAMTVPLSKDGGGEPPNASPRQRPHLRLVK